MAKDDMVDWTGGEQSNRKSGVLGRMEVGWMTDDSMREDLGDLGVQENYRPTPGKIVEVVIG
jgi:hypothetical protein